MGWLGHPIRDAMTLISVRSRVRAVIDWIGISWRRALMIVTTRGAGHPVCDDVSVWAKLHQDTEARVLAAPRRITREMPRTIEPELHPEYTIRGVADQKGRYLVPIHGAQLVGARGMLRLPDGSIASESLTFAPPLARERDYLLPPRRLVAEQSGRYFSLVIHWSGTRNYYHWFHDVLTRLHGVLETVPPDTKLIVPRGMRAFQRDSLCLLGIPEGRLIEYDGSETWTLETLYFAPRVSNVGSDRGDTDRWLRDRVLRGCGIVPRSTGRRVFISRRGAAQRRLDNEDEVVDLLARFGFETVTAEDLSLQEQAALCAQAAVLASTHGAGLTNMLFSAPGLKVIEMLEPARMKDSYIYWAMAEQLGHEYWYFVADAVPRPMYQNDVHVPLAKLEATLVAMNLDDETDSRNDVMDAR